MNDLIFVEHLPKLLAMKKNTLSQGGFPVNLRQDPLMQGSSGVVQEAMLEALSNSW